MVYCKHYCCKLPCEKERNCCWCFPIARGLKCMAGIWIVGSFALFCTSVGVIIAYSNECCGPYSDITLQQLWPLLIGGIIFSFALCAAAILMIKASRENHKALAKHYMKLACILYLFGYIVMFALGIVTNQGYNWAQDLIGLFIVFMWSLYLWNTMLRYEAFSVSSSNTNEDKQKNLMGENIDWSKATIITDNSLADDNI